MIQESIAPIQSVSFVVHRQSIWPTQENITENLKIECYLRSRI